MHTIISWNALQRWGLPLMPFGGHGRGTIKPLATQLFVGRAGPANGHTKKAMDCTAAALRMHGLCWILNQALPLEDPEDFDGRVGMCWPYRIPDRREARQIYINPKNRRAVWLVVTQEKTGCVGV